MRFFTSAIWFAAVAQAISLEDKPEDEQVALAEIEDIDQEEALYADEDELDDDQLDELADEDEELAEDSAFLQETSEPEKKTDSHDDKKDDDKKEDDKPKKNATLGPKRDFEDI